MNETPQAPVPPTAADNRAVLLYTLQQRKLYGSKVLYRIAGWSALNTFLVLSKANLVFIVGLGITYFADAVGQAKPDLAAFTFGIDAVALLFFLGMGRLAVKGQDWALWTGMIVYVLDGLLMLYLQQPMAALFHLVMVRSAWSGLQASYQLRQMVRQEQIVPSIAG